MIKEHYIFPTNVRAARSSVREQAIKQIEEAREVLAAIDDGEPLERVLEEEYDLVQATEGFRRKFDRAGRDGAICEVLLKSSGRGDYGIGISIDGKGR